MNLLQPLNFIAQKLLYLWIRADVTQTDDLNIIDEDVINIYVMASRAWSDLLVLEQECHTLNITNPLHHIRHKSLKKWHHVYTVASAQPLKAWLKKESKRSSMLGGIQQALIDHPELDIHFIPVVVFWGRPVLKQKHWSRVLFSETWGFAGRTRRLFTILFNGKNTLLQFSPSISYREIIDQSSCSDNAIDTAQKQLSQRLIDIKTSTLGPDVSHRRTLVRELLNNEAVTKAIRIRSDQNNISEYKATKTAQGYLEEIVADRSYITIQIGQRILSAFWNKFYSGINVHFSAQLKKLALTHELVYVPCHRSHIDYLLLSYVILQEGMPIPYIAAGKNLNMPIIGSLLRKGGAFFIRRSFKGNDLYSTIMFEYVASQLASGMPVEYFVEGGRSRTGRLLQPRPGMLAMTIRAFLKYRKRPIAFIPVYIGYEKMIEGKAYLAELKGDDKKSETFFGSIKSIFNIRGFYGRVTTSFGQAVLLDDMLEKNSPDWRAETYNDKQRPDWLKPTVKDTSQLIMQRINESCSVNTVNLIATALLAAPNQTMDEGELKRTLNFYSEIIKHLNYSDFITITDYDAEKQIHYAEELGLVHRRKHEMGDFIYLDNAHAILLTYYRNNILHLLVMPSLIACCFNNAASINRDAIIRYLKITYPFLKNEFFLPWPSEGIENTIDEILSCLSDKNLINKDSVTGNYHKPQISTEYHAQLSTLGQIISPVLELYYMIFALLAEHGSDTLSRERLEELCHLMAQRLSLMYELNSPDFFDKKLIANFINSLISLGYVKVNDSETLDLSAKALEEGRFARRLLDKNMQYNILQMLRASSSH